MKTDARDLLGLSSVLSCSPGCRAAQGAVHQGAAQHGVLLTTGSSGCSQIPLLSSQFDFEPKVAIEMSSSRTVIKLGK